MCDAMWRKDGIVISLPYSRCRPRIRQTRLCEPMIHIRYDVETPPVYLCESVQD